MERRRQASSVSFDADLDGLFGVVLKIHVERGVDAVGIVLEVAILELVEQLFLQQVDEVGGLAGLRGAARAP